MGGRRCQEKSAEPTIPGSELNLTAHESRAEANAQVTTPWTSVKWARGWNYLEQGLRGFWPH